MCESFQNSRIKVVIFCLTATMVWMVGMADNDGTQGQNNKKKKRKRQSNPDETGKS